MKLMSVATPAHSTATTWWRKEQAGRRPNSWVARRCLERAGIWCLSRRVLLLGPRTAMLRRCERGLWNDEFHEPVEDAGSSSQGRCRGRQCTRDDRRPCFSHRVSSARGVTSVRGHQRINDLTSRQWEPTMHQFSVPAPHPKLLPEKSLTSAREVTNQLWTPNPHSVIASDVEKCRSTLPQLCLHPFLLNQARVSEPEAEHKTQSVW